MDNKDLVILAAKSRNGPGGSGMTDEVKQALLACFADVIWADDQGQAHYDALEAALYPLDHITAVYTQSDTVYDTDSLDSLKADLVVTAVYEGGNTETVSAANYTLSGTLTVGTSTITVSYGGKTTTFDVVVSESPLLPREYQQVEWISANNDSVGRAGYINTGIIPTPDSSMFVRFAGVGTQQGMNFVGSRDASSGADKAFVVASFLSVGKVGFMRWGSSVQCIAYDNDFHDYELTPSTAKVDNVSYTLTAPASQTSTKEIQLFAMWNGAGYGNSANIKLAYFKFAESGTVTHEYIPCYRKADNEIGLYDLTTSTFLPNDGDTPLTKGADVT